MNCRFLNRDDLTQLRTAYVEAFSNYPLKIEPTEEQLLRVLMRNGLRWDISVGIFDEERLVAFTANGFDLWEGEPTAYDSGTGVVRERRRRGLARQLFDFMLPHLREQGISRYMLEVISTNEPALRLYEQLGFEITRALEILELDQQFERDISERRPEGLRIEEVSEPDWTSLRAFWTHLPAWPNTINAVKRSQSNKLLLAAHLEERCVGYGIVSPTSGDIPQLAVAPDMRRRGIGSALLRAMQERLLPDAKMSMNNVASSCTDTISFCAARGFKRVVTQLEMALKL